MKATYFALGRHQLKCWRARLRDPRHVKLVEIGAVGAARGKMASSMGLTPWEQLWWMLGAVVFSTLRSFCWRSRIMVVAVSMLLATVIMLPVSAKTAFHVALSCRRLSSFAIVPRSVSICSGPYLVALALSMVEHALESRYAPWLKEQALVSYTGLAMVVVGEALRKLAVITANKSFTHDIKVDKRQEHKLVTHGIYSFFRHPSYLGFFIWSIGTQVLLVNPVCTVGYIIVTWRFFDHRIPYEEYFLRRFFGQDYVEYASKVPSGMPFIK